MTTLSVLRFIELVFNFYSFLVLAYCLLSWFPRRNRSFLDDLARALDTIVGPYLNLFRRFIPAMGGIDFSPVLALLALNLIERLIINILVG
ncbi:MAG: YggT family protein [Collinsella sp.]|nr:YggT family protein [Collinsella sp.]